MGAETFWAFSVAFYGRPGVAPACIAVQDTYGADVGVLLFALWCASRGRCLELSELAAVDTALASWRTGVVQPIRHARRTLKATPAAPLCAAAAAALRERILAVELEAERLQQLAMEALAPPPGAAEPGEAAAYNVACFARHIGMPPDAAPLASLLRQFS
jgi:uncharacterized protein (TIGR02444 family)